MTASHIVFVFFLFLFPGYWELKFNDPESILSVEKGMVLNVSVGIN